MAPLRLLFRALLLHGVRMTLADQGIRHRLARTTAMQCQDERKEKKKKTNDEKKTAWRSCGKKMQGLVDRLQKHLN